MISRFIHLLIAILLLPHTAAFGQAILVQSAFAEVNGHSVRYQLVGEGEQTVVLIHELGMSLESWDDIVSVPARKHRVLRHDLRGFGLSEKLSGAVRIEDHVADLEGLLNSLGIDQPVILVGSAVGGSVALRFAADHPRRAAAVMAVSPASDVPAASRPAYLERAAKQERGGMRADVDASLDGYYPLALRSGHGDRFSRFRALQYANDPVSMAATLRMIAVTEWADVWPRIKCPVWFVAVTQYKARPVAAVQAMAAEVERGHFESIDTGPFAPIQSPELFGPLLAKFLKATHRP